MSELSSAVNSSVDQVSGTIDLMAQAARDGAVDARAAAARVLSKTGVLLSRVVYSATYTISYGVVFPAAFVARGIPRNNAAVRGLIDGAHAASQRRRDSGLLAGSTGCTLKTPSQAAVDRSLRADATPSLLTIVMRQAMLWGSGLAIVMRLLLTFVVSRNHAADGATL